jgi:beta-1,2-mannobiose phosphorylase / 1,2-beta-oligomannan phosphorylase
MIYSVTEDYLIFEPADIDLSKSPLRKSIKEETYILGVFNPGMERLPNGNIILMVRVAEALSDTTQSEYFSYIRWDKEKGFLCEKLSYADLDTSDPRKYIYKHNINKTYSLTSFSWILPVELNSTADKIEKIHYDKAVIPVNDNQEYGIEDARLSKIGDTYYMTACSVSSFRQSTVLYKSSDGINYDYMCMVLDHQNKDMVLFPEKIGDYYYALTRPMGEHYFYSNNNFVGPSIQMSKSPDLIHWAPVEKFRMLENRKINGIMKTGGGAQPGKYNNSWLVLFHVVKEKDEIGIYDTYYMLLDESDPTVIKEIELAKPLLSSNSTLTNHLNEIKYMDDVVFTTGLLMDNDEIIFASGELDLCCRMTKMKLPKTGKRND